MASSEPKTADTAKDPAEAPPVPENIGNLPTNAARIRALAALGWERPAIAKALGVRYQQVANTLGPIGKPAAAARAVRKAPKRAPKPARASKPERAPEPEPAIASETAAEEPAANSFPARHLWRLPGIVAFGAIAALLLGLLWAVALARLVFRLAGTPGEEMAASAERSLSAWLMQILDYLRGTDHIDDLPFPFTRLP